MVMTASCASRLASSNFRMRLVSWLSRHCCRVDVASVHREVPHVHLAFWAFLDGVAAFLQNADGGIGVPFEEMETHAVGISGFSATVRHRALVKFQQFGAGHPPISRRLRRVERGRGPGWADKSDAGKRRWVGM